MQILEVNIFSVDKSEDVWEIEGELILDDELNAAFSANYDVEDDSLEMSYAETNIEDFDGDELKTLILDATSEFEFD